MKYLKRTLRILIAVCCLCAACVCGINAQAAARPSAKSFELGYMSSSKTSVRIDVKLSTTYAQVALCNYKGKVLQSSVCSSSAYFYGLKANRLYYYKVRGAEYSYDAGGYVAVTKWSSSKAFCTAKFGPSLASKKSRVIVFKFPKVTGISKYMLYISTKSAKSGFKRIKTITPGKALRIYRLNGKNFQYYKTYYYKIIPIVKGKKGLKAENIAGNFYLYRTFG